MDTNAENIFDDYFDTVNLNNELETFYTFINNDELTESFIEEKVLTDIRNDNYNRYNDINLSLLENLSPDYEDIVSEIKKVYSFILPEDLLTNDLQKSNENKKILDLIYKYINQVENQIQKDLIILEKENNERQFKIKQINYKQFENNILEKIMKIYNDIVIYNSVIENNIYDNYKKQLKRKKDINKIYRLINLEINDDVKEKMDLNDKINDEIKNIYNNIQYLEDLMPEKSIYYKEFNEFKDYFNNLIAYDDTNYLDVNNVYNELCNNKIKSLINYFEESFIKEIENNKKEEEFVYEKYGIKNIKNSLDYVSSNYVEKLNEAEKNIINKLYDEINNENYNISELYCKFKKIINRIWKDSITKIYSYNEKEDFCFICANNQFIDEKYQTIIITKRMLERVNDYSNYQIGFICDFNDNILYVTENDDIMTIDYNDMSNLKTPKQIEQEFINFKVSNKLALNGYITRIEAVYFINDGDMNKYKKAVELANQYNLPLIVLKKDKN